MSTASLPAINGGILLPNLPISSFSNPQSPSLFKWELRRNKDARLVSQRNKGQAFRVLANPNVSPARVKKEVIMVDPLEAKRLAAKQMVEIKAREKFKKRRQAEAINGVWAMIGLTAGLVIERPNRKKHYITVGWILGSRNRLIYEIEKYYTEGTDGLY